MDRKTELAIMGIKRYTHKGIEILKGFYPNDVYTVFFNGDDLVFKTLKEARNFIEKYYYEFSR